MRRRRKLSTRFVGVLGDRYRRRLLTAVIAVALAATGALIVSRADAAGVSEPHFSTGTNNPPGSNFNSLSGQTKPQGTTPLQTDTLHGQTGTAQGKKLKPPKFQSTIHGKISVQPGTK
jgi:hypothetical protein